MSDPLSSAFQSFFGPLAQYILNPIIGLLFAIAIVMFLWGVAEFLWDAGSDNGREKGRQHMLWGVIGLAIMVSAYGIINFIGNSIYGTEVNIHQSGAQNPVPQDVVPK